MSRSYKKTPFFSNCGGGAQKEFRSQENRAKRNRLKQLMNVCKSLHTFDEEKFERNLPHEKEYGNEWSSPRDGKSYWQKPDKNLKDFRNYGSYTISYDWYELWLKTMRK